MTYQFRNQADAGAVSDVNFAEFLSKVVRNKIPSKANLKNILVTHHFTPDSIIVFGLFFSSPEPKAHKVSL